MTGHAWPLITDTHLPTWVTMHRWIWSQWVKRYARTYGELPEKNLGPSRPTFQGHSRWSELTPIDRVHMTSIGLAYTVSKIQRDIGHKLRFFSEPMFINCQRWGGYPWNYVKALWLKRTSYPRKSLVISLAAGELGVSKSMECDIFPFSAVHCETNRIPSMYYYTVSCV